MDGRLRIFPEGSSAHVSHCPRYIDQFFCISSNQRRYWAGIGSIDTSLIIDSIDSKTGSLYVLKDFFGLQDFSTLFCFVCLGPGLLQWWVVPFFRDLTSSPREVCSRVCNRTSRLATFQTGLTLPGRWYCLGTNCQFNPNTTLTAVI